MAHPRYLTHDHCMATMIMTPFICCRLTCIQDVKIAGRDLSNITDLCQVGGPVVGRLTYAMQTSTVRDVWHSLRDCVPHVMKGV
jgi:hypothetical protein